MLSVISSYNSSKQLYKMVTIDLTKWEQWKKIIIYFYASYNVSLINFPKLWKNIVTMHAFFILNKSQTAQLSWQVASSIQ